MNGAGGGVSKRVVLALVCLCAALAFATGSATAAAAATPVRSPLLGYPRFRGVIPVRGSTPGIRAREKAVATALAQATSRSSTRTAAPASLAASCESPSLGADLCWHGGPVVREHTVHLIFWEGPKPLPTGVAEFPSNYQRTIEEYFNDVAQASGANSNVYSVGAQYGDESGETGLYKVLFASPTDVYFDTAHPLPASGSGAEEKCRDSAAAPGACITDEDLHEEIEAAIAANPGWKASLKDIYLVFTPPNVGSCFVAGEESATNGCAFGNSGNGYCAYHASFNTPPALYINAPDNGNVAGCDSFEHPHGAGGVDATLDSTSHEHNEAITDPTGESWYDAIGQEMGDKCLPPEVWNGYGAPIGGEPARLGVHEEVIPGTLFNQIFNEGDHYWLQTEWSNAAGEFQGGCVQRMVNTAFTPPSTAQATVPASFDGSASGTPGALLAGGDPVIYWEWDFGDEELGGEFFTISASPTVSHTYALPGRYQVTLTAVDELGNSNTTSHTIEVGTAPVPPAPPPPVQTPTVTVTTPTPPPIRLTVNELAAKLGLPRSGASLAGLGTIALGRAECPPACGVTLGLYATVHTTRRGHRTTKQVLVGSLRTTIAPSGTGGIALKLNAAGRALLRRAHRLRVVLKIAVEDQQGASWQISRPLTLISPLR
jgi:hypothetical protein